MAKKYVFVRMPEEIYRKYRNVGNKMNQDLRKITGKKDIHLTMPKVFNAIISPDLNEHCIQVDFSKMINLARKKKGKYDL